MVFKCYIYVFICIVYLLNSLYSEHQPDSWLCGGVLISTTHVLTAAACLTDVSHIYVIAGYRKYVNGKNIQDDKCTRTRKQRIVKIIIPKAYTPEIWIKFDVGIGIVEKPYDFTDLSYRVICSYEPGSIQINYNISFEAANTSVYALGWGGTKARIPGIMGDINSEYLMEADTVITNISFCQTQFTKKVDFYFLCTYGYKDITEVPEVTDASTYPPQNDCDLRRRNYYNETDFSGCFGEGEMPSRRDSNGSESSVNGIDYQNKKLHENTLDGNHTLSRRQAVADNPNAGICQNDHGGPLVSLAGDTEIVIGIALNSVYSYNYQCQGPFLYLSTARSSVLIKCLLAKTNETRELCGSMNNEIKEYEVMWPDKSINQHASLQEELENEQQDFEINSHPLAMVRVRPQLQFKNSKLNTDVPIIL